MDDEVARMVELATRAQAAWDQYNVQLRLPDTGVGRLPQAHPWDAYNNGQGAAQARRDPAIVSAAWNELERALLELSYSAERARGGAATSTGRSAHAAWRDTRTGAFTQHPPAAGTDRRREGRTEEPAARDVGVVVAAASRRRRPGSGGRRMVAADLEKTA